MAVAQRQDRFVSSKCLPTEHWRRKNEVRRGGGIRKRGQFFRHALEGKGGGGGVGGGGVGVLGGGGGGGNETTFLHARAICRGGRGRDFNSTSSLDHAGGVKGSAIESAGKKKGRGESTSAAHGAKLRT